MGKATKKPRTKQKSKSTSKTRERNRQTILRELQKAIEESCDTRTSCDSGRAMLHAQNETQPFSFPKRNSAPAIDSYNRDADNDTDDRCYRCRHFLEIPPNLSQPLHKGILGFIGRCEVELNFVQALVWLKSAAAHAPRISSETLQQVLNGLCGSRNDQDYVEERRRADDTCAERSEAFGHSANEDLPASFMMLTPVSISSLPCNITPQHASTCESSHAVLGADEAPANEFLTHERWTSHVADSRTRSRSSSIISETNSKNLNSEVYETHDMFNNPVERHDAHQDEREKVRKRSARSALKNYVKRVDKRTKKMTENESISLLYDSKLRRCVSPCERHIYVPNAQRKSVSPATNRSSECDFSDIDDIVRFLPGDLENLNITQMDISQELNDADRVLLRKETALSIVSSDNAIQMPASEILTQERWTGADSRMGGNRSSRIISETSSDNSDSEAYETSDTFDSLAERHEPEEITKRLVGSTSKNRTEKIDKKTTKKIENESISLLHDGRSRGCVSSVREKRAHASSAQRESVSPVTSQFSKSNLSLHSDIDDIVRPDDLEDLDITQVDISVTLNDVDRALLPNERAFVSSGNAIEHEVENDASFRIPDGLDMCMNVNNMPNTETLNDNVAESIDNKHTLEDNIVGHRYELRRYKRTVAKQAEVTGKEFCKSNHVKKRKIRHAKDFSGGREESKEGTISATWLSFTLESLNVEQVILESLRVILATLADGKTAQEYALRRYWKGTLEAEAVNVILNVSDIFKIEMKLDMSRKAIVTTIAKTFAEITMGAQLNKTSVWIYRVQIISELCNSLVVCVEVIDHLIATLRSFKSALIDDRVKIQRNTYATINNLHLVFYALNIASRKYRTIVPSDRKSRLATTVVPHVADLWKTRYIDRELENANLNLDTAEERWSNELEDFTLASTEHFEQFAEKSRSLLRVLIS